MESVDKFFIPENRIEHSEGLDYSRVDDFIRTAEAFSRATYQSVYIIDYFKKKFLYVSPNSLFWGGLTPDEVCDLNYRFYLN
ncbi:MAG: helix-turn-helix transcriptional regulator, partial [Muribaculaceae bacterium]|nr:helix-turn-helix transcriptional regulator [Muribaculaceae bacterium]